MTFFVNGSGASFEAGKNDVATSDNAYRGNVNAIDYITVYKNGYISLDKKHTETMNGRVNTDVYFKTNRYNDAEINLTAMLLYNAISYQMNLYDVDEINLTGASNGGNTITRYMRNFDPQFVNKIITAVTPYNGLAVSQELTGFLKSVTVMNNLAHFNSVELFYSRSINPIEIDSTFSNDIASDGVVSNESNLTGLDVWGVLPQECYNQNHGTYMRNPIANKALTDAWNWN